MLERDGVDGKVTHAFIVGSKKCRPLLRVTKVTEHIAIMDAGGAVRVSPRRCAHPSRPKRGDTHNS